MKNRFKLADSYLGSLTQVSDFYNNIWFENTTALLHAPRNIDKSSIAMDIALRLTNNGTPVFYLTTGRLSAGLLHRIEGNLHLYVHQPTFSSPDDPSDYADIVFKDLEEAVKTTGVRVFVIDSITRIADLSFGRNASPAYLMKRLIALQTRYRISILVVAHDNSKAGTRALVNLSDSEINVSEPTDSPSNKKTAKDKKTNTTTLEQDYPSRQVRAETNLFGYAERSAKGDDTKVRTRV